MSQLSEQEVVRRESMNKLREMGINPYPAAECVSTHYSQEAKDILEKKGEPNAVT
jgi:lysyl-tRNA synthetase class 2